MLSSLHWWLRWLNDLCVVKGAISFRELEEGCVRVVVSVRSSCADTEARTQRFRVSNGCSFQKCVQIYHCLIFMVQPSLHGFSSSLNLLVGDGKTSPTLAFASVCTASCDRFVRADLLVSSIISTVSLSDTIPESSHQSRGTKRYFHQGTGIVLDSNDFICLLLTD